MRDHGGDLGKARARWGKGDWLDLSTGINPVPYPMPALDTASLTTLPGAEALADLEAAARIAYATRVRPLPLAGAQAAIQLVPHLKARGRAAILGPTYNEHAAALRAGGWAVSEVSASEQLEGADLAIVVSPNNPDGRRISADRLEALSEEVGLLIVDESFADADPSQSLAPRLGPTSDRIVVLRSFGKFYGLAGLRLGFALTGARLRADLAELAGPWAVSGPAIAAGRVALRDLDWQRATRERLEADSARLDTWAAEAGWTLVGGTTLFRTYETPEATEAQDRLASHQIWSRIFPYSTRWLRLGMPGDASGWDRLRAALS